MIFEDLICRGNSYAQIWSIANRGRPVGKRLEIIVSKLPKKPSRKSAS